MNDIKVKRDGELIWLNIDGKDIHHLFDAIEFILPLKDCKVNSRFFFTCTCGIPGCAGWEEGINVTFNLDTVTWDCLDDDGRLEKSYTFNLDQYAEAQKGCMDMLYDIAIYRVENPRPAPEDPYDEPYDDYVLSFSNPDELTEAVKHRIKWLEKYG